jgi:hypothetical protein
VATVSTSELRAWARNNGFPVADRGRLPAEIRDAWEAAQPPPRERRPAARASQAAEQERPAPPPPADPRLDEVLGRLQDLTHEVLELRATVTRMAEQLAEQPSAARRWGRKRP